MQWRDLCDRGETKAMKEVNFTVQQSSDGKITVSVVPFQF
jgi:hypothetical protein